MGFLVPQENPTFPLEGFVRSSPHQNFPRIWAVVGGFVMPEMSISRNYDSHSSRLSLGKRGLAPIPKYSAHILLPYAASRMAEMEHDDGWGFFTTPSPMAGLFPLHMLEDLVSAK